MVQVRKILWPLALAAVVLAAGAWWRLGQVLDVPTAALAEAELPRWVRGPGSVQARVPLTLSTRITAAVTEVLADVGDEVPAGQPLVLLDAREPAARRAAIDHQREALQATITAADAGWQKTRAEQALAGSRLQRDADLQRQGFLSPAGLETAQTTRQAADAAERAAAATLAARRAELGSLGREQQVADATLSHTRVAAPFAAVVVRRLVEPGTVVVPGTPLLQLVDVASLWVRVQVDEAVLAQVQPGQPARIQLRSGQALAGQVVRIARQADAATREVDVFVAFTQPPGRLAIDQEARVDIETGRLRGLVVPATALLRNREGRPGLLLLRDGRARFVPALVRAEHEGQLLIEAAPGATLQVGDTAITAPAGVRDGMRVRSS